VHACTRDDVKRVWRVDRQKHASVRRSNQCSQKPWLMQSIGRGVTPSCSRSTIKLLLAATVVVVVDIIARPDLFVTSQSDYSSPTTQSNDHETDRFNYFAAIHSPTHDLCCFYINATNATITHNVISESRRRVARFYVAYVCHYNQCSKKSTRNIQQVLNNLIKTESLPPVHATVVFVR